ncbi:MAG TPA: response regulator [bacterium]
MTKILLADDMRNFLDLEISFLRRTDCRIITAKDGVDALKLAKEEKPDIILLDLEMPRMTGIEACRILKNDEKLKKIPIVIVTSHAKKNECLKVGADYFIQKPVNEVQLLLAIKKFVSIKDRIDARSPISVLVIYKYKNKTYAAYTRDLSSSGVFIITRDLLPIGAEVKMEIELAHPKVGNGIKVKADANVIRIEKGEEGGYIIGGMGVRFSTINDKGQRDIKKFIEAIQSK